MLAIVQDLKKGKGEEEKSEREKREEEKKEKIHK